MAVSKVIYGNDTLIDLTSDTVDAAHLASGYTAHTASGVAITGTAAQGVSSVNDMTGDVTLDYSDVGAVQEPATEGTNGQVLTTDGNGGRSWTTVQGGGTVVTEIFIATYDTTTYAEITAALTANKACFARKSGVKTMATFQVASTKNDVNYYTFSYEFNNKLIRFKVSDADEWTSTSSELMTAFEPGDTYSLGAWRVILGYLTGSNTNILFTLPLGRALSSEITGITCTEFRAVIRSSTGSYLANPILLANAQFNISDWDEPVGMIYISLQKSNSGSWGGTNNAPVSLQITNLTLVFS